MPLLRYGRALSVANPFVECEEIKARTIDLDIYIADMQGHVCGETTSANL